MAATLRAAVKAALSGDGTLSGLLTGGVYDRRGLSRTLTPAAFDATTGNIKPCAVVTVDSAVPMGHREQSFERVYLLVWLYEQDGSGYTVIDQARLRVIEVLHDASLSVDDGAVHTIEYASGIGDSHDDTLGAEMTNVRFVAYRNRGDGT